MERRDLDAAGKMLAPDFEMIFPGNASFSKLEDLVKYGKSRQKTAYKVFTAFDQVVDGECTVVYASGTLFGQRLDGAEYNGVRFVDRFTMCGGLLNHQSVWNDMGRYDLGFEKRPVEPFMGIEMSNPWPATKESRTAQQYLQSLDHADIKAGRPMLSSNFKGIMPGGLSYASVEQFVHAQSETYKSLHRNFQRVDEVHDKESTIIYSFGVLDGEAHNEASFHNVRFVDRLVVSVDEIVSHMMWDDTGEYELTGI